MSGKNQNDFSDMSRVDAVSMVVNTAVVAKMSGHPVHVNKTELNGIKGIVIWIPGYELENRQIRPLKGVIKDEQKV